MFTGLSAFPLTPLRDNTLDESAFSRLIERVAASGVDSITALGSTGAYVYLSTAERARVSEIARRHAGDVPLGIGIGALRTSDVVANARAAESAGADFLLLSAVSYQPLTEDDVYELFRVVTESTRLPVVAYDNPTTTHFAFSDELYGRVAALSGVQSIKIPGVPTDPDAARARIDVLRSLVGDEVAIGVSGDACAATGLNAGCDLWYSVIGGTVPELGLRIARAARDGRAAEAVAESDRLAPLWALFSEFGSQRVVAALAEHLSLVPERRLPLPILGLDTDARSRVAEIASALSLEE